MTTSLYELSQKAYRERRRLAAPLVGFPGLKVSGSSIKVAQQNSAEHFKAVKANVETFMPDMIFPLMDLSVEANALGKYTDFPSNDSATVLKADFSVKDLDRLEAIDISSDTRLQGYLQTMRLMSKGLPPSILRGAYVTGPYTLAALLLGAEDAAMATLQSREDLHSICTFATKTIREYATLLVDAGAQAICILEPSGVMLGPSPFAEFSARYVARICETCSRRGVPSIYHVCGNSMHIVDLMAKSGVEGISLDSSEAGVDLHSVAKRIPENIVLIGNLSPVGTLLNGRTDEVVDEVTALLREMESVPNFILSTGCDVPRETPLENIRTFMHVARNYSVN